MECAGVDSFACGFREGGITLSEFIGNAMDPVGSILVALLAIFAIVTLIVVAKKIITREGL